LQEILDQDPEFSQIDEVIYLLGEANERLKKPVIASTYYKRVIKEYPGSQFVKKARERLADLKIPADQEEDSSKEKTPEKSEDRNPDSGGPQ
jgi:outer membrane protein assembly factor BamD (BamD/ComL family)